MTAGCTIRKGVPPGLEGAAARLYWHHFGPAICPLGLSPRQGAALTRALMQPDRALVALGPKGAIIGIAGLRSAQGGFLDLSPQGFRLALGLRLGQLALASTLLHRAGDRTTDLVLDGVAVRRGWQRRGLAGALIAAAETEARRLGYPGLRAEVEAGNLAALAAWQAMGFQRQGRRRLGWIWSAPALVLRRPLPARD